MKKLWVFGDSFSVVHNEDQCPSDKVWPVRLASSLEYVLESRSTWGASQDWISSYIEYEQNFIAKDDQIVVILTDPARFWFFEDMPSLTGSHIINFDKVINHPEKRNAARGYIEYIQRPQLDTHFMTLRLGHLNNLVTVKQWRQPIIIKASDMHLPDLQAFDKLKFSIGSLRNVDSKEQLPAHMFANGDIRYNHLCLSNHEVLVNKLFATITTGAELDLETGFFENCIPCDALSNQEFVQKELCPALVERNKKQRRFFR